MHWGCVCFWEKHEDRRGREINSSPGSLGILDTECIYPKVPKSFLFPPQLVHTRKSSVCCHHPIWHRYYSDTWATESASKLPLTSFCPRILKPLLLEVSYMGRSFANSIPSLLLSRADKIHPQLRSTFLPHTIFNIISQWYLSKRLNISHPGPSLNPLMIDCWKQQWYLGRASHRCPCLLNKCWWSSPLPWPICDG